MNFKEYVEENGIKITFLSKKLGVCRQTIYRLTLNHPVSPELASLVKERINPDIEVAISSSCGNHIRNRIRS